CRQTFAQCASANKNSIFVKGAGVHRVNGEWVVRVVLEYKEAAARGHNAANLSKQRHMFVWRDVVEDTRRKNEVEIARFERNVMAVEGTEIRFAGKAASGDVERACRRVQQNDFAVRKTLTQICQ